MPLLIDRPNDRARLTALLRDFPVVALIGPRQVGKSTLARQIVEARRGPTHFFDLERDADRARLADPMLTLGNARGLVVIDEVQHVPELFRSLRVLADEHEVKRRFLVPGSAAPALSAPDLYRYPAIDPDTYRADLDAALSDTADAVIRQRPSGQTP